MHMTATICLIMCSCLLTDPRTTSAALAGGSSTALAAAGASLLAEVGALELESQGKDACEGSTAAMPHDEEGAGSCQVRNGSQRRIEHALLRVLQGRRCCWHDQHLAIIAVLHLEALSAMF